MIKSIKMKPWYKIKVLYVVGSIIQIGDQNTIVWGSGLISNRGINVNDSIPKRDLDVRAVRGPLTRKILLAQGFDVPEIYGDPAILMPLIYNPPFQEHNKPYLLITHVLDQNSFLDRLDIDIISCLTNDFKSFINSIIGRKKVISTSLHGIIISEAYGVPVVFLHVNPELELFKFYDYYASTGRESILKIATTLDEALNMEPMPLPDFNPIVQKIIDAFPFDIF